MAEAFLRERLLVGGAAIALVFLVVFFLIGCFLLLAKIVDHYRQIDTKQAQALAEQVVDPAPREPVVDTEPGIRLDWRDECDLLFTLPAYQPEDDQLAAGCDRLLAAIRDERTGEASDA